MALRKRLVHLAKYQDAKRAFDKAIQIKSDVPEAYQHERDRVRQPATA
jgi:hypothetical protein